MKVFFKRAVPVILSMVCAISLLGGCTEKTNSKNDGEKEKYTMAVRAQGTNYSGIEEDALYKEYSDKFGVELEITELPTETMAEKVRLMVAAGDVPDALNAPFVYAEYLDYANQGLISPLPDGWEKKYPNLAWSIECTGLKEVLGKTADKRVYAMPRVLSIHSQEKDDAAVNIDTYGILYRKDWTDKLGIEVPYIVEYEEFMEIVKKVKNADFHNGNEIMGISVAYTEAPHLFVSAYNSNFNKFYKKDGKYIYGLTEDATLEGMKLYKKAYKDGILHPNFYAHGGQDALDRFYAGKAVAYFGNAGADVNYNNRKSSFGAANPGIDPAEAVGLTWIKAPDGKVHGFEKPNQWMTWYLSPELSEERADKLLSIFDYVRSAEGFKEFNYGVEGIDYTKENDEYKLLTWEEQADGSFKRSTEYKFDDVLSMMSTEAHEDVPFITFSTHTRETAKGFKEAKLAEKIDLAMIDYDINYFEGAKYKNFNGQVDVNTIMAEIVVSDGDLEKEWNAKLDSIKGILEPALKEVNAELLGDK